MKVTEKEDTSKKQDTTKEKDATGKDKEATKEVKETKDADTLTFEGNFNTILSIQQAKNLKLNL